MGAGNRDAEFDLRASSQTPLPARGFHMNRQRFNKVAAFAIGIALWTTCPLAAEEPAAKGGLLGRWFGPRSKSQKGPAPRGESRGPRSGRGSSVEGQGPAIKLVEAGSEVPSAGPRAPSASGLRLSTFNCGPSSDPQHLTLDALEQLARENNPTLAQAAAVVEAARGRQIQAGLYTNPTVGYSGAEIGNDGRAGQQGIVIGQEIVRGGKLTLSSAVAGYQREQAEAQAAAQMLRVLTAVRSLFYDTLAAEQALALTRELVKLAEQGVSIAQQREKAGEGTLTETLQAQIELEQVRILDATAANNYRATWKRLAAVVGRPEMEPAPLAGNLETPREERDEVGGLAQLAAQSPEVRIAEAGIRRAEAALQRARVEPIPNVTLEAGTQHDFASNNQIANVAISFPIPIRNRNQGSILAAESELLRSQRELDRVKLSLAERFAVAYARYRNALQQVERYGQHLPEQEVKRILSLMGDERQKELEKHPQILPRAQIALALATEGWQRGQFGYLEVLTAQRTLTQASLGSVRSLGDLRQSIVTMDGYLLSDGLGGTGGSGSLAADQ